MDTNAILERLRTIHLPSPPKPVGAYRPVVESNGMAFLSGQISMGLDGKLIRGKIGRDLSLEDGQLAARACALNAVSLLKSEIGFERIARIVKVTGYVQADSSFDDIHLVMNGASELFYELFGEAGVHVRSAVGVASLPLNAAVEVEVTVELND